MRNKTSGFCKQLKVRLQEPFVVLVDDERYILGFVIVDENVNLHKTLKGKRL